jgi:hypothetical protein
MGKIAECGMFMVKCKHKYLNFSRSGKEFHLCANKSSGYVVLLTRCALQYCLQHGDSLWCPLATIFSLVQALLCPLRRDLVFHFQPGASDVGNLGAQLLISYFVVISQYGC